MIQHFDFVVVGSYLPYPLREKPLPHKYLPQDGSNNGVERDKSLPVMYHKLSISSKVAAFPLI
jgi:hypothetical protein